MKKILFVAVFMSLAAYSFPPAMAQAPVGIRAIGVEGAWFDPENIDNTWGVNAFVDVGLPLINFYVQPFAEYWSKSEPVPGTNTELSYSDFAVGGKLMMSFPVPTPIVHPFVGAGVAAHTMKAEISGLEPLLGMSFSGSDTRIGYHFGGGVRIGVHDRIAVMAEGWYSVVEDFNQTSVRAGLAWTL